MAEYSRAYIASGGPTSRLEDALAALGRRLGFASEVFATPTGAFVSVTDPGMRPHTTICRIKEGGINLERLCWLEEILDDLDARKLSLYNARRILGSHHLSRPTYSDALTLAAAFAAGFSLSYPAFGRAAPALASGLIGAATWWVTNPGLNKHISSSIFRDFIGCVVTLLLSAFFQLAFSRAFGPAPFEAYSIGGIIILVPGLALTTAIAELADQNLISGTSKFMQAMLTLLALGLAYLLFSDLSASLGFTDTIISARKIPIKPLLAAGFLAISMMCFGVILKVPRKALPLAALTGILGWSTLSLLNASKYIATAPFLAALCVGLVAMTFGKRYRVPSQVFSVPGILALLPGMLALTSIQSFALGRESSGLELAFRVALTAGSITFGLFTARIPFAFSMKKQTHE